MPVRKKVPSPKGQIDSSTKEPATVPVIDYSNESKSDKFKRIAKSRMHTTIRQIELIGNCSNRSTYEYTPEQVNKMFTALQNSITEAQHRFSHESKDGHGSFDF